MNKFFIYILLLLSGFIRAQNPHGDVFSIECSMCHTSDSWKINSNSIRFNHDSTLFALEGQHKDLDCKSCHATLIFKEASQDCISCHTDVHQSTLGFDCGSCHTSNDWGINNIDELHDNFGFPLLGVHKTIFCDQCHTGASELIFEPIGLDCINCHSKDYFGTQNPNHDKVQFSQNCESCHNIDDFSWSEVNVDISMDDLNHDFFPLEGGHQINDCNVCHEDGSYTNSSSECISCHQGDYDGTTSPSHSTVGIGTDCAVCHTTEPGWSPAEFSIHDEYYELTGAHIEIQDECLLCHTPDYKNTPTTCEGCHIENYNSTQNPNHSELNINTDCASCHTTEPGWSPAEFAEHDAYFVLEGGHDNLECTACHINGNYSYTSSDCFSCHSDDYNGATFPRHQENNFSTKCNECHTTNPGWKPAEYTEHDAFFPLTLGHGGLECIQCHKNGTFEDVSDECISCHQIDYNNSTNPNHKAGNFSMDCKECHTTEPGWRPAEFPVHNNYWEIDGAHVGVDCAECHNGNYNNTPNQCEGCHTEQYNSSTNPNHKSGNYPMDCKKCHTTEPGWRPAEFPIHDNFWLLDGGHIGVDCNECHKGSYNTTPNQCEGCHMEQYNSSTNPNHKSGNYPMDCNNCHATGPGWSPANFPIHDNFWVLDGAHLGAECAACHKGEYTNTPNQCQSCHIEDYNGTKDPNHKEFNFETDCAMCHTADPGWSPALFDKHNEFWVLDGAHLELSCVECHSTGYSSTPSECIECHEDNYNSTTNPNHRELDIPKDCQQCHTTTPGWRPANFDVHNEYWELTGAHLDTDCNQCHSNGYSGTPTECEGCHMDNYNNSTDPNHAEAGFPTDCATCHTTDAWQPSSFNHDEYWELTGAHESTNCNKCHTNGYAGTPTNCDACHIDDYNSSTNPNHQSGNYPTNCDQCHTTEPGWSPAEFPIHNNYWVLDGAHIGVECSECHNGDYNNTATNCEGCHMDNYNNSTDPNHVTAGFPTECVSCHTTDAWQPSTFNHNNYWELTGAHENLNCNECHANGYSGTPTNCVACHIDDYNNSTNPNHQSGNYPTNCDQCHTTEPGWSPAEFPIHNNYWEIDGAHVGVDCAECHNGNYNNTPNQCDGCHIDDYNGTTNPDHQAGNYPTDCNQCHTTNPGWSPADFPIHNDFWVLDGAHTSVECSECHNGDYNNTPTNCDGCHIDDYNSTTDPDHQSGGFPTDCSECHTTDAWTPSTFDHNNYWELTGAHLNANCNECHVNGYAGTPTNCDACHIEDYNNSTNPDHQVGSYPTDCDQCHTTESGWSPAEFPIHNDYWVLDGAHTSVDCAECHNGDYNNTPTDCEGCHMDDYNNTTNPDHSAAGFPTDCASCHTTDAWEPSTFDHDGLYFPIYSGKHEGEWDQCSDCHYNNSDYSLFTCTQCHPNSEMDQEHDDVSGYSNDPEACLACHPDGEADD